MVSVEDTVLEFHTTLFHYLNWKTQHVFFLYNLGKFTMWQVYLKEDDMYKGWTKQKTDNEEILTATKFISI